MNFILGQSHFIKTVEDIHEAIVTTIPGVKFGLAFCEASGSAWFEALAPIQSWSSCGAERHWRSVRGIASSYSWVTVGFQSMY